MRITLFLMILNVTYSVFCQELTFINSLSIDKNREYFNYYSQINNAEKYVLDSMFTEADSVYYQLFYVTKTRPFKIDVFKAFKNSLSIKENSNTDKYLKDAIHFGLTKKELKNDGCYNHLSKNQKQFFNEVKPIELDEDVIQQIHTMFKKDQKARAFWTDWLSWEKQVKIMDKIDTVNVRLLLELIEQKGFPGISKIGEKEINQYAANEILNLILHFNHKNFEKILPYLLNAVRQGEFYPYYLARCVDYLYMSTKIEDSIYNMARIQQLYGTVLQPNSIIPFGEIDEVNSRRALLGLEPVEEYALKRNVTLPVEKEIVLKRKK